MRIGRVPLDRLRVNDLVSILDANRASDGVLFDAEAEKLADEIETLELKAASYPLRTTSPKA